MALSMRLMRERTASIWLESSKQLPEYIDDPPSPRSELPTPSSSPSLLHESLQLYIIYTPQYTPYNRFQSPDLNIPIRSIYGKQILQLPLLEPCQASHE